MTQKELAPHEKIPCTVCHVPKEEKEFYKDGHRSYNRSRMCIECTLKHAKKVYKTRTPVKRVNFAERINRIVQMDSQANEYLSADNRPALRILAAEMEEFGLHQRAQQLRMEAG